VQECPQPPPGPTSHAGGAGTGAPTGRSRSLAIGRAVRGSRPDQCVDHCPCLPVFFSWLHFRQPRRQEPHVAAHSSDHRIGSGLRPRDRRAARSSEPDIRCGRTSRGRAVPASVRYLRPTARRSLRCAVQVLPWHRCGQTSGSAPLAPIKSWPWPSRKASGRRGLPPYEVVQIDALMFVNGSDDVSGRQPFLGLWRCSGRGCCWVADRTGMGRSGVEGKLLLGHAQQVRVGPGTADESLAGQQVRQPTRGSGRPRSIGVSRRGGGGGRPRGRRSV
jgi:hypothetical protein